MGTFEIVRAGRLATTVRKQFTIAVPDAKNEGLSISFSAGSEPRARRKTLTDENSISLECALQDPFL